VGIQSVLQNDVGFNYTVLIAFGVEGIIIFGFKDILKFPFYVNLV
jgi:hypothetical protein